MADGHAKCATTTHAFAVRIDRKAEIGVALTSFGGLFMLLGVMLFFDGALLALGNVRPWLSNIYMTLM